VICLLSSMCFHICSNPLQIVIRNTEANKVYLRSKTKSPVLTQIRKSICLRGGSDAIKPVRKLRCALFAWESLHSVAEGGVAPHVTELAAGLER
jgi:hypothetical protein